MYEVFGEFPLYRNGICFRGSQVGSAEGQKKKKRKLKKKSFEYGKKKQYVVVLVDIGRPPKKIFQRYTLNNGTFTQCLVVASLPQTSCATGCPAVRHTLR